MVEIVGKVVNYVCLSRASTIIMFIVEGATEGILYETDPDCCNSVWIYSIDGLSNLLGNRVIGVQARDWVNRSVDPDQEEVIEDKSFVIKTSGGYTDIVMRNEHNGYYGGSLNHLDTIGRPKPVVGGWKIKLECEENNELTLPVVEEDILGRC